MQARALQPSLRSTTGGIVMSESDFQSFLAKRTAAAEAYVNGDPEPVDELVPDTGEATFLSPMGDSVSGAASVAERYRRDAGSFRAGGESRLDFLQKGSSGDLGFWTGYQIATVRMREREEPIEMRIRVTEVLRRIDGEWKMIHRHADIAKQDS
jgi:ketosteroid isomerase-like protein